LALDNGSNSRGPSVGIEVNIAKWEVNANVDWVFSLESIIEAGGGGVELVGADCQAGLIDLGAQVRLSINAMGRAFNQIRGF